ncbi:MAG: hypothetical protein RLP09_32395 [Sandaracinaceae bacterium]
MGRADAQFFVLRVWYAREYAAEGCEDAVVALETSDGPFFRHTGPIDEDGYIDAVRLAAGIGAPLVVEAEIRERCSARADAAVMRRCALCDDDDGRLLVAAVVELEDEPLCSDHAREAGALRCEGCEAWIAPGQEAWSDDEGVTICPDCDERPSRYSLHAVRGGDLELLVDGVRVGALECDESVARAIVEKLNAEAS